LIAAMPSTKYTTIASDIGLMGPIAVDSGRSPPMIAMVTSPITSPASFRGLVLPTRADSGRGRPEQDQHERLHRDSAKQVSRRQREIPPDRCLCGDRELGQRSRQAQEEHAADRFAEVEAVVEDVGRPREVPACDPSGRASGHKDRKQCAEAKRAHGDVLGRFKDRSAFDGDEAQDESL
jgi:hypothetical protein